jgi:hypothetical protein
MTDMTKFNNELMYIDMHISDTSAFICRANVSGIFAGFESGC